MTPRIGTVTDPQALRLPTDVAVGDLPTVNDVAPSGPSFSGVIEDTLRAANTMDAQASAKVDALAAGKLDDLHGTMITAKEAEISLKLVGSVRNKLLDAFRELWRTNV